MPDTRWDTIRDVHSGSDGRLGMNPPPLLLLIQTFRREEKHFFFFKKKNFFSVTGPLDKCLFDFVCAWGRSCSSELGSFLPR